MIGFFPYKSLYFECYATMPMLADAHILSLGYLWWLTLAREQHGRQFALCMIHFGQFFNILSTSTANELKKWWWERKIFQMIILWGFFLGFVMAVWIILLIMPTMHPCSLRNLRNFLCMTKPQLFKFYQRNPHFFPHKPLNFCYCKISLQRSGITLQRSADS